MTITRRPLLISSGKANRGRIGGMMSDRHPFIAKDVDTIDAANTDFEWFGFNHDAYLDAPILMYDLAALLKRGVRPLDERSRSFVPETAQGGATRKSKQLEWRLRSTDCSPVVTRFAMRPAR